MNHMANHRVQRVHELCSSRGWGITELANRTGYGSASYWSDVLRGEKSFGEKAARKLEECLGLPRCWLDDTISLDQDPKAPSQRSLEIALKLDAIPEGQYKSVVFEVVERLLAEGTRTR